MSDVQCPECDKSNEINHDDGHGYEEGELHEQDCTHCGTAFKFETSVSFNYEVFCGDGKHDLECRPVDGYGDL